MKALKDPLLGLGGMAVLALFIGLPASKAALGAGVTTVPEAGTQAGPAQDPVCKVLFSAFDKTLITPNHSYVSETVSAKDRPKNNEQILAGGIRYIQVNGKWRKSPVTTQQLQEQDRENRQNAKEYACRYVREEPVQGESAAVYNAHSKTEDFTSDAQVWVSKSRGLILREEEVMDMGDAGGKFHISIRYEYGNVQAPAVSQ
ncbi:MAG: hypothetical protein ACYDCM_10370 [Candidatus Acidiferrales bacterium]